MARIAIIGGGGTGRHELDALAHHLAESMEDQLWAEQGDIPEPGDEPAVESDQKSSVESPQDRARVVADLMALRRKFPKLEAPEGMINVYAKPPESPSECVFARTTTSVSADFETRIEPCQFGGTPDCSNCGCVASAGLAAVERHKLWGFVPVGAVFSASVRVGEIVRSRRERGEQPPSMRSDVEAEPG